MVWYGGIDSEKTWNERLILAESILAQIRKMIADSFANMPLISPELGRLSNDGLYHTTVKLLMGIKTPFVKIKVDTKNGLNSDRLFMLAKGQTVPLELLPLVRIMESPRTARNACYFYSRLEKEEIHWVSYHFEDESQIVRSDNEALQALNLLRPK